LQVASAQAKAKSHAAQEFVRMYNLQKASGMGVQVDPKVRNGPSLEFLLSSAWLPASASLGCCTVCACRTKALHMMSLVCQNTLAGWDQVLPYAADIMTMDHLPPAQMMAAAERAGLVSPQLMAALAVTLGTSHSRTVVVGGGHTILVSVVGSYASIMNFFMCTWLCSSCL
jgi:hypothetical protein